jgi:hypothetical protein
MARQFFRRQGQGLALIRAHISPHEEAGATAYGASRAQRFPVPPKQRVFHGHIQIKLGGGKNIAAHGTGRAPVHPDDFALQGRVGHIGINDSERAILLELFDDRAGNEDFNARDERAIRESRDRDGVDLAQITGRSRTDLVTGAALEQECQQQWSERFFHYGVAAVSGEGCGEAEGTGVDSFVEGGGAVVVSGRREAGGGSETSESDGGSGACSFEEGGAEFSSELRGFRLFLLAAAGVTEGDCSLASPTFARSSLILFLALSPSAEPGCCRITSL